MLKARKNEQPPLGGVIVLMEELYFANLDKLAEAKVASANLVTVKKTERTKKKEATTTRKTPAPRRTHKDIGVGTELAMYCYDMEMEEKLKGCE
jgi:hypothetical protein